MTHALHSPVTWWIPSMSTSTSFDLHIQFTVEKESRGQLPFLDVLLTREEDGTISTEVYQKPTDKNQYLTFDPHHPAAHKRAVVRTLMCQAEALSSSGDSHVQEEKRIQDLLQRNGYPAEFIMKHTVPQQGQRSEEQAARVSVTISYIHGLSQLIRRVLSSLAIKVTFCPLQILRQELKDPIAEWQRKGVVYSVPYNECSHTYIGQTGRSLDHRIAEHWRALRNGDVAASQEWRCGGLSTSRACVYCWAQRGFIQGNSDQCSPLCPDLLPSWVLAHPARTDPPQHGKGNIARTLCHPAELTLLCVSIISSVLNCI